MNKKKDYTMKKRYIRPEMRTHVVESQTMLAISYVDMEADPNEPVLINGYDDKFTDLWENELWD